MHSFFDYQYAHAAFFQEHGTKLVYKKGQYLVTPNESSPWVYFLVDGLIDASFSFSDGSKRIIGYFLPGMSFAQSGAFFVDSGGGLEYIVVKEATIYRINQEAFLRQLKNDPEFNSEYMNWLLKAQILLIERIVYQGEATLRNKLLRWFLFMGKYYGSEDGGSVIIEIPIVQDTIADFLHVTRESVGKELRKLMRAGVVDKKGKFFVIPSVDTMRTLLE